MGYVYYGIYAQYYEVGRVELLRSLGVSYKSLEKSGFELPVLSFNISYLKPLFYDDNFILKTCIKSLPSSKIKFNYWAFKKISFRFGKNIKILNALSN